MTTEAIKIERMNWKVFFEPERVANTALVGALIFSCFAVVIGQTLPQYWQTINLFCLLAYILAVIVLFYFEAPFTLFVAFTILATLMNGASVASIEAGEYMRDQDRFGFLTGATSRLIFYDLLFLSTAFLSYRLCRRLFPNSCDGPPPASLSSTKRNVLVAIVLFMIAIIWFNIINFGSPVFSFGATRSTYWETHPFPRIAMAYWFLPFAVIFLGYLYREYYSARKWVALILFGLFLIVANRILIGAKAWGTLSTIWLFTLTIVVRSNRSSQEIARMLLKLAPIVIGLLALALAVSYYLLFKDTFIGRVMPAIAGRLLGEQGHVWWGIDLMMIVDETRPHYSGLQTEFGQWMHFSWPTGAIGSQIPSDIIAIDVLRTLFLDTGARFSALSPSVALYYFGPIALIPVQIIFGLSMGIFVFIFHTLLRKGLIIGLIPFYWFYANVPSEVFSNGNLNRLFALQGVITFTLFILSMFCYRALMSLPERKQF